MAAESRKQWSDATFKVYRANSKPNKHLRNLNNSKSKESFIGKFCVLKKCLRDLTQRLTLSYFPQKFLTNPSKLRIYLHKIPIVITETLIGINQA